MPQAILSVHDKTGIVIPYEKVIFSPQRPQRTQRAQGLWVWGRKLSTR